jgi:hypothetical protein
LTKYEICGIKTIESEVKKMKSLKVALTIFTGFILTGCPEMGQPDGVAASFVKPPMLGVVSSVTDSVSVTEEKGENTEVVTDGVNISSIIYENGINVGIGEEPDSSPMWRLRVNGSVRATALYTDGDIGANGVVNGRLGNFGSLGVDEISARSNTWSEGAGWVYCPETGECACPDGQFVGKTRGRGAEIFCVKL